MKKTKMCYNFFVTKKHFEWVVRSCFIWFIIVHLPTGLLFAQSNNQPVIRLNSEMHTNTISSIDTDAAGELILTTSKDRTAKLWDAETSQLLKTFRVPIQTPSNYGILYGGALTPDGQLAVIAGVTGDITSGSAFYMYDTHDGKLQGYEPTFNKATINNLKFSPDGRYLMVSFIGDNPKIIIYKAEYRMGNVKMEQHKILEGYDGVIPEVKFDQTGRLAMASSDGSMLLYDANFNLIKKFKGSGKPIDLAFSPDNKKLAVAYSDSPVIEVFETDNFQVLYRPKMDEVGQGEIYSLTFSEDGRYLIGGGTYSKPDNPMIFLIRRWDNGGEGNYSDLPVETTANFFEIISLAGGDVAFSSSYPGLGRMQSDGQIRYYKKNSKFIFHLTALELGTNYTGDEISFRQPGGRYIFSVPNGQLKKDQSNFPVSTDQRNNLIVSNWRNNSSARINGRTIEFSGSGRAVDVSPDGGGVALSTQYNLYWFDAKGTQEWVIGTEIPIENLKVSGNGNVVVAAHTDGTIRWYNAKSESEFVITRVLEGSFADRSGLKQGDTILNLDGNTFGSNEELIEYIKPRKEMRFKLMRGGRVMTIDAFKSIEQFGFQFRPKDRLMSTLFIDPEDYRWIMFTPGGNFDASPGGEDLAGWHINQGLENAPLFNPLSQYFEEFYTTNLGNRVLSGEIFKSHSYKLAELPPPAAVEIISPENGTRTDRQSVTVEVKVTDQGGGIDEIRLYHNGKLVETTQRGMKVSETTGSQTLSYDVAMIPGENQIQATAFNDNRQESMPANLVVHYGGTVASSDLYVLAVGINEYKNTSLNLNYGRPDAEAFTAAIEKQSAGIFRSVNVTGLVDGQATRDNMKAAFEEIIAKAQPQDSFLFFYAGHGVMSEPEGQNAGDFYMALHGTTQLYGNNSGLKAEGISASEMTELARRIPARKQMIVLDACQSGGAVETFAMRGAAEQKAIMQLARSAGLVVMASTGTEQFATEFGALGHGVFTYALLDGLSGKADGGSKDGKITVQELNAYLNDQVPELTQQHRGQSQYPNSYARGQDFPIGIITN